MPNRIEIRRASTEEVQRFYKGAPIYSTRAVVALRDGVPIGLGGVCRVGKRMVVFTDFDADCGISKKDIVRAGRGVLKIMERYTLVYAYADKTKATAMSFAKHFGFDYAGSRTDEGDILVRCKNGAA